MVTQSNGSSFRDLTSMSHLGSNDLHLEQCSRCTLTFSSVFRACSLQETIKFLWRCRIVCPSLYTCHIVFTFLKVQIMFWFFILKCCNMPFNFCLRVVKSGINSATTEFKSILSGNQSSKNDLCLFIFR